MNTKARILYSGFYDFPLAFTARHQGRLFLFRREFDDDLDDYPQEYRVYLLPSMNDEEIISLWGALHLRAARELNPVAVRDVRFDATHQREIETDVLERLLANAPHELAGAAPP